tara:strand:- start:1053 stop:1982 length:930 start_codon:yes stop_codon:yes gene_type:complete
MIEIKRDEFYEGLDPVGPVSDLRVSIPEKSGIEERIEALLKPAVDSPTSVLALDSYRYSQKGFVAQTIIPLILRDIHRMTETTLKTRERMFFPTSTFIPRIDTGDGAFLIFPAPIHALLYAIWFEIHLRIFNSYRLTPQMRALVGSLTVRYALTHDALVKIEPTGDDPADNQFYGPAIINAARIVAQDKLNRFLLSEQAFDWFTHLFTGIENLQSLSAQEIAQVMSVYYPNPASSIAHAKQSILGNHPDQHYGLTTCDVQQIGEIQTKDRNLAIYNLHIQALAALLPASDSSDEIRVTVSIGNQNPLGL